MGCNCGKRRDRNVRTRQQVTKPVQPPPTQPVAPPPVNPPTNGYQNQG